MYLDHKYEIVQKINVLFAEYNTERYEELFLKSKKFNTQIFFYGRRRPPFWNVSTLKTIIKSRCKIITNKFIDDKVSKANEDIGIQKMQKQISDL